MANDYMEHFYVGSSRSYSDDGEDPMSFSNAGAIWDASIVKVILGGTSSAKDLQDLSVLIGERDEKTDTISVGDYGSRSLQRSIRQVPVMPPEVIRTLPFGTALVLLRSAPPLVTDLRPWTARKDAGQLREQRTKIETELRRR